jgi:hypothetical protein
MLKRGDRWLVYDVVIEGVSLISNYRTQFNKIITTSSYEELVKKMKTKQEEFIGEESRSGPPSSEPGVKCRARSSRLSSTATASTSSPGSPAPWSRT